MTEHKIFVKFPREAFELNAEAATEKDLEPILGQNTEAKLAKLAKSTIVRVHIKDGASVKVSGFSVPFACEDHDVEQWVNNNAPIVGDLTLALLLKQRDFCFIVGDKLNNVRNTYDGSRLSEAFEYPYGTKHDWKFERFKDQHDNIKLTKHFKPAYR